MLAIRSDCIYIQGDLPSSLLKEKEKYHLEHYRQVSFQGDSNIFIHDSGESKSFANGQEREELILKYETRQSSRNQMRSLFEKVLSQAWQKWKTSSY